MGYEEPLLEIRETSDYADWFGRLRDRQARQRINVRIRRLQLGNPGDARPVGDGVSELRIHYGPGYRVYYTRSGCNVIVLLAGGDKSTQPEDILAARALARQM